ncbi:MAG: hypothetical protein ACI352_01390 [Elusimicrobiaceae bacterium]|nr:hypothetical protein [Elusimicrobiota bacterium]
MKKLISFLIFVFTLTPVFAFSVADNYTHNSRFWRNSAAISFAPARQFFVGAEFDVTEHKDFDNHIYAFRLPFGFASDALSVRAVPFFLPDNGNDSWAYGGKLMFSSALKLNEVDGTAAEGYLSAGIVSQKADVLKNGVLTEKDTFIQAAYEAGVVSNFFGVYLFNFSGNVYQYLSGLEGVKAIRGVFNQSELADLGTIDYMLGLPRASGGVKATWRSEENRAETFISYRYIDMHDDDARHSLLISTNVLVSAKASLRISYNHIFVPNQTDSDIYGIGLNLGL